MKLKGEKQATIMDKIYQLRLQALGNGLDAWGIVLDYPTLDKLRAEASTFMVCQEYTSLNSGIDEIFGMRVLPVWFTNHNMTIVDEFLGRKIMKDGKM